MRLLTHNILRCPSTGAYPLALTSSETDHVPVPFRRAFITRMLPRLDYPVLLAAAAALDVGLVLPASAPSPDAPDEELQTLHEALMEWHVVEGVLAGGDGMVYLVQGGIPNLIPSQRLSDSNKAAMEE